MSTLKQAEAVAAIYKSQGKDYDFDEINAWDGKGKFSQKASDIISANYRSYDKVKEKVMEKQKVEKTEAVGMSVMPQPEMAAVAVQPQAVIEHAQTAAKALTDVLKKKAKLVMINNERYLEYEDWQTLGRFYGISAGAASTEEINRNGRLVGFSAKAEAWQNGVLVSSAEASCMREERNLQPSPSFNSGQWLKQGLVQRPCGMSWVGWRSWQVTNQRRRKKWITMPKPQPRNPSSWQPPPSEKRSSQLLTRPV